MALEPQARRTARVESSLAERPGATPVRRRGQGHEIREIRPFAEGDDPRHIDAAATARSGALQIRSFHEDRERSLFLIADFRRPMLWGLRGRLRSVAAAEALALAGWQAALQGGAVGVAVLTDAGIEAQPPRPRHRGMALVAGCLERAHAAALAAAEGGGGGRTPPLGPELERAARQAPRGALIQLATGLDHPGPDLDAALAALCARGPVQLLLIEDSFETAPPTEPLPFLADPADPASRRLGGFAGLPAARTARAERLTRPGLQWRRLNSSRGAS